MSLIQGYSSGEDEDPVSPTNDAFGLASLPTAKKPRVELQKPTSVIPHSAPDVLSEVRDAFDHFHPHILKSFVIGPLEANLAYHPTHRYADEREHHL